MAASRSADAKNEDHGTTMQVLSQTLRSVEVLGVDVTVRGSDVGHVGSVQHHRDDVVGQDVEELLCHVVLGGKITYNNLDKFNLYHLTETVLK